MTSCRSGRCGRVTRHYRRRSPRRMRHGTARRALPEREMAPAAQRSMISHGGTTRLVYQLGLTAWRTLELHPEIGLHKLRFASPGVIAEDQVVFSGLVDGRRKARIDLLRVGIFGSESRF